MNFQNSTTYFLSGIETLRIKNTIRLIELSQIFRAPQKIDSFYNEKWVS